MQNQLVLKSQSANISQVSVDMFYMAEEKVNGTAQLHCVLKES